MSFTQINKKSLSIWIKLNEKEQQKIKKIMYDNDINNKKDTLKFLINEY